MSPIAMKIKQKRILRSIFSLKGNFTPGVVAQKKVFDDVEIAPFRNACSAAVSISADFELNWAWRCLTEEKRDRLGITERSNVPYILGLLGEFDVPITWATVGHLFLASCTCKGERPHKNMPRPPLNTGWRGDTGWQGDWYKHDPCTDLQRDPLWYAPDLIEQIMRAKQRHEVGSHTFSHINFSPTTSDRQLVEKEMEESLAGITSLGLTLRSLVFPFNFMGYQYSDLLHQFGVIAIRHRDKKTRLSYPERTPSGIYKIYESMNLRSPDLYYYRDKAELFIAQAVNNGAAYHLWFHPSAPRDVFKHEFCEILQIIQRQREAGNIWVATMGDLAAYCEARECMSIHTKTEKNTRTLQIRSSLNTDKYGVPCVTLVLPNRSMPEHIDRRLDLVFNRPIPEVIAVRRNGTLLLDVPALSQTITLWF